VFGLVIAVCRDTRRLGLLIASGTLLLTSAFASQRAALISVAISVAVLVIAFATRRARERLHTTPTELVLGVVVLVALVIGAALLPAIAKDKAPNAPFAAQLQNAFGGIGKAQSAAGRVKQLDQAKQLILQHPFIGWGLAESYSYYQPGPNDVERTQLTHNILTYLLLRTGLIGLAFFLVAFGASVSEGIRSWRYNLDPMVAALALAATAILLGWFGKGLVESLFEKYRLATVLGITLGIARTCATSAPSAEHEEHSTFEGNKAWI